ncbi:MAG: hypothetical protein ACLFUS_16360 [Candidatus Sumerlaeia bacterium]
MTMHHHAENMGRIAPKRSGERRQGPDRRQEDVAVAVDRRSGRDRRSGFDRRSGYNVCDRSIMS